MFTRHVSHELSAFLDRRLPPARAQIIERHLQDCPRCRSECEQVRAAMAVMEHLPLLEAPEAVWSTIEAESGARASALPPNFRSARVRWQVALLASSLLVFSGALYWRFAHPSGWIETGAKSRTTIKIGQIGFVEVAPNTRVRVVKAGPEEHRLALARGEIRAVISAPPKLFFVDTAAGTAVDLGCEYVLNTSEAGSGLLRVTRGWVSFQWKGLESLIPAGASCPTDSRKGPGIPYFDDAPESLKQALEFFGSEKSGTDVLGTILSAARVRDTLTLWHLLSRVDMDERARVFDRIAALTPVPSGVTREQALRLNPQTLQRWKDELAWRW